MAPVALQSDDALGERGQATRSGHVCGRSWTKESQDRKEVVTGSQVRARQSRRVTGRILVGADDSVLSVAAVRWAISYADTVGGSVDVVTVWDEARQSVSSLPPSIPASSPDGSVGLVDSGELASALEAQAREVGRRCVRRAGAGHRSVTVRTWATRGSPGPALCDLSSPTDLVVVGPGGHGLVLGAVVGSVAAYLVSHAPCPVVVVRQDDPR